MKTIAITMDETLLLELDRLSGALGAAGDRGRSGRQPSGRGASNRSALVRRAVAELLERERRRDAESGERRILERHRARLARESAALVAEQARP